MWSLAVALFTGLLGALLDGVAARGRPVPLAMRLAPFAFLLVAGVGGVAEFTRLRARLGRRPVTTAAAAFAATEATALVRGRVVSAPGAEWAYRGRQGHGVPNLTVRLDDEAVSLVSPRVYGERLSHRIFVLKPDAAVVVEGVPGRYTDGGAFMTDAFVYHPSMRRFRVADATERWVFAAGALVATAAISLLGWRAARRAWARRGPAVPPPAEPA